MTTNQAAQGKRLTLDTVLDPAADPRLAAALERAGFGCAWVTETVRDPYLCLGAAAADRLRAQSDDHRAGGRFVSDLDMRARTATVPALCLGDRPVPPGDGRREIIAVAPGPASGCRSGYGCASSP